MNNEHQLYVGMDLATTAGVAVYIPITNQAIVFSAKAEPIDQFKRMLTSIQSISDHLRNGVDMRLDFLYCLERVHHFRNAKTSRSLIERYGFVKYALLMGEAKVVEVNLNSCRSWLKVKTKEENFMYYMPYYRGSMFTSDHADALTCALYQASNDGVAIDWLSFNIVDYVRGEE